jgi:RHS repeat-associated protein
LLEEYKGDVNWAQSPRLDEAVFTTTATFDAINRPTTLTTPDASVARPRYNEANLLQSLVVNLRGASETTHFVTHIDYNAKGQRELIEYSDSVRTLYTYDPLTFRMVRLLTRRQSDSATLQDLNYAFDPVGNITSIVDHAQETIYFKNHVVSPSNEYAYDALYRLICAGGREHAGKPGEPETTFSDAARMNQPSPSDGHALHRYREQYEYDAVGNILELLHLAQDGQWSRHYHYGEANAGAVDNRLTSTRVGQCREAYAYDAAGNTTRMPQLRHLGWDFKNQLCVTRRQETNIGSGESTYYVYDSTGARVRKVTERPSGSKKSERAYLGGFEIYRRYDSVGRCTTERETLHVMDDKGRLALVETKTVDDATKLAEPTPLLRFQLDNHLGSAVLEIDARGAIISYEEYYPYGSTAYEAVRKGVEVSPKRYRYTGKERDEESGFYYHGSRYYAPWLARWTSPDPIGIGDGLNLYRYVSNNPLNLVDRTGNEGTGADHPPAVTAEEMKSKQQGMISDAQKNVAELQKESGQLQVEQFDLVNARNSLDPGQKAEAAELQKKIDANGAVLTSLYHRTEEFQQIIADSQKVLDDIAKAEEAKKLDPVTPGADQQSGVSGVGLGTSGRKFSWDYYQLTLLPRNLEIIPVYKNGDELDVAFLKEPGLQLTQQYQPDDSGKGWSTHTTVGGTIDLFNISSDNTGTEGAVTASVGYDSTGHNVAFTGVVGVKQTLTENRDLPIVGKGTNKVR